MRTIRIFLKLCELNVKKLFIYRASFLISLIINAIWIVAYVSLIEVIFLYTGSISGWSKGQMLLLTAFYYLLHNLSDIFFTSSIDDFGEKMRRGELDFKIIKPAPTRLITFFEEIRFDHIAGLISTSFLFIYAINNLGSGFYFSYFLVGFIAVFFSLVLYFSLLSIIATMNFWMQKNDAFGALIFNLSQVSKYPRQIYNKFLRNILSFIIPVALLAAIPAEIAIKYDSKDTVLFFIFITIVFYILSMLFWNLGLKKYTSAN